MADSSICGCSNSRFVADGVVLIEFGPQGVTAASTRDFPTQAVPTNRYRQTEGDRSSMPKTPKRKASPEAAPQPERSAKREPRQRERELRRAAEGHRHRKHLYRRLVLVVAGVAVVLAAGYFLFSQFQSSKPVYAARMAADQGRDHVPPGQVHPAYNTTPPTSGWHYETAAPWGVHDEPLADETQVHNLEHGGIVIHYWCPDGCPELVAQLKALVGRYRSKVLLAPYSKPLLNRIALTAWRWIDAFDDFDEQRIVSFIDVHKDRGPEQVPD